MAAEKSQNVQDVFLNHIRKNKVPVTVFLVNGVKLQGIITWFDNFSVLLRRDAHSQLVYKHAISTVMPSRWLSRAAAWPPAPISGSSATPISTCSAPSTPAASRYCCAQSRPVPVSLAPRRRNVTSRHAAPWRSLLLFPRFILLDNSCYRCTYVSYLRGEGFWRSEATGLVLV